MSIDALNTDRAKRRLHDETIAWLTTVRSDGQPQTSPVGFAWDGTRFLILSQPNTAKIRNVMANPKVTLHLDTEAGASDGGVLTIEGTAELNPGLLAEPERSAYVAKYLDDMQANGFTPDEAFAEFSQVIRVTPTRARMY
jgi:PPOX class probable F420-dependent enzyme